MVPKGTLIEECGKMLAKGPPKKDKNGNIMKDKSGKVVHEPYVIKVLNTINFSKSLHYNPWGNIGNNYLKGLFALAFQGFFMMVCVGIYAVLVNAMTISSDLHAAMFSVAAYTVILAFSLFKTGSLSKSIFNAH